METITDEELHKKISELIESFNELSLRVEKIEYPKRNRIMISNGMETIEAESGEYKFMELAKRVFHFRKVLNKQGKNGGQNLNYIG